MTDKGWSEEERAEYEALMTRVLAATESMAERVDLMDRLLADAVQAQRFWASEVERESRRAGYASRIKRHEKERQTVLVAHNGALLTKPRVIGTTRRVDGRAVAVQTLFDAMTWDELEAKRSDYLVQMRAYDTNIATIDRLLALRDLAPDSATPEEAAAEIGTDIDTWLGQEAS